MSAEALEAQWSVIGSMLIDNKCVGAVVSMLREEDFTDPTSRNTFQQIKAQFLEGKPVDPVLIQERLGGGAEWVSWARQVMELTPTAANVECYAGIVKDAAALGRLREQADKLRGAFTLDEARRIIREMSGLVTETGRMERMGAAELAKDFWERLTRKEKPEYLPWGIPSADRVVYAERGDMILLGGYPSAGKTLLSIQMALAQARRHKVVYYTLETKPEKMADRMFAHLGSVSLTAIKRRDLSEQELSRLAEAASRFTSDTPIEFVRAAGSTVDDIAADAISCGAEIVYIDYLQLIEGPGRDRFSKVTEISRGIKLFAQGHNVAVVALTQLSRPDRDGKQGKPVPPSMQSFRESGQLEQDADVAFLLWPEDSKDNRSRRRFKLAKNKEGRRFNVPLDFDGLTQTMIEVEETPDSSIAAKLCAEGRAIKAANRARAMEKTQFQEVTDGDDGGENPFKS